MTIPTEDFESLGPEEQLKVFSKSSIKERGDLILHAHEPLKLTQALSNEELYLITREMDPEERSEVIRYANLRQLFFISDIDCWQRDQISPKGFIQWLEILRQADEAKLFSWLLQMDFEALVAGFQKFVRVLKPEWEYAVDEVLGDQPYFTLDRLYYILVEEENFETVRRAFEVLYENHKGRYAAILEGILGEMEYEVEETAYRRREVRLSDQGFPDYETAVVIYNPLDRDAFNHFPAKRDNRRPDGESKTASIASQYPVLWDLKKHFLDDALSLLGQEDPLSLEGVYEELAWIANKLIVAHGMDLTSEDKMKWAVQRTRALVNLGLEVLSQKDFPRAVSLLKTRWVETVFRYGIYELFLLRDGAKKIVSKYWENKPEIFRDFLSLPYDFIMTGLLENIPRHYDFESIDNLEHLRDFHDSEDLARARQSLDQISNIHDFIARSDPSAFPKLVKPAFLEGCNLYAALGTFFVRTVLDMKRSLEPLSLAAIRDFRDKAFDETGRLFRPETKESFLNACFSTDEQVLLRPLWGLVFQSVLDSMPALNLEKSRVLGAVEGFLVKAESPRAKKKKPAAVKRGKPANR